MLQYSTIDVIFFELVLPEMKNTIYMLIWTTFFSLILGLIIALVMICTQPEGLHPNRFIYGIFEVVVDFLISMPFIVLAVTLIPLTRLIVGTSMGKTAAVVPLTTVTMCVIAKLIYDSLLEVNVWVVEAAKSFGASDFWVYYVMIKEAWPEIISGTTLSTITTLASTAMMGALGAGGVGYVAVVYGYQRTNNLVIATVVIVLIVFTQIIQYLGDFLYRKWR